MFAELAHLRVGPDVIRDLEEKHGTRMRRIKRLIADDQALEAAKARRLQEHLSARQDAELTAREIHERYLDKRRSLQDDRDTSDTEISDEPFRILVPKSALEPPPWRRKDKPESREAQNAEAQEAQNAEAQEAQNAEAQEAQNAQNAEAQNAQNAEAQNTQNAEPTQEQPQERPAQEQPQDRPQEQRPDRPQDHGAQNEAARPDRRDEAQIHNAQNMDAAAWHRWHQWNQWNQWNRWSHHQPGGNPNKAAPNNVPNNIPNIIPGNAGTQRQDKDERRKDSPRARRRDALPLCQYFCRRGTCSYKEIYGRECRLVHPSSEVLEAARRDVLSGAGNGDVALAALNIMMRRGLLRR